MRVPKPPIHWAAGVRAAEGRGRGRGGRAEAPAAQHRGRLPHAAVARRGGARRGTHAMNAACVNSPEVADPDT